MTFFLFQLRGNIALETDLALARMELEAFIGKVEDAPDIVGAYRESVPALTLPDIAAYLRPKGQQGYTADAPLSILPELIRRVSFVQAIYVLTDDTPEMRAFLHEIEAKLGPVLALYPAGDKLLIYALPHYALMELSEIAVKRSKHAADTKRNLALLLDALMGRTQDARALQLADAALSAQSTTSHLSHDVHYYKAKFFPRMARAMLNVCSQAFAASDSLRVIDNFAGSGTTLLESSLLGMESVGLDLDPLSVLIAKAKLDALSLSSALVEEEARRAIDKLLGRANGQLSLFDGSGGGEPHNSPNLLVGTQHAASLHEKSDHLQHSRSDLLGLPCNQNPIVFPRWLLKNRRMTPEIAAGLSTEIVAARTAIADCHPNVRDLFRVLLSDAVTGRIKMRFLGTGVGRFSLTFSKMTLSDRLAKSLAHYAKVTAACEWLRETLCLNLAPARVLRADTRAIPETIGKFDILLTSPPYLPASSGRESYAKARAPSLIALGMTDHENVDSLVDDSIGSMEGIGLDHRALSDQEQQVVAWLQNDGLRANKAEPTARYFLDMRRTFAEMYRILNMGGKAVVVSGKESTFYHFATRAALYVVPSAQLLADEARAAGYEVEALHDMPLKKGNMNARPRSLDEYYETLIFLGKSR